MIVSNSQVNQHTKNVQVKTAGMKSFCITKWLYKDDLFDNVPLWISLAVYAYWMCWNLDRLFTAFL